VKTKKKKQVSLSGKTLLQPRKEEGQGGGGGGEGGKSPKRLKKNAEVQKVVKSGRSKKRLKKNTVEKGKKFNNEKTWQKPPQNKQEETGKRE